MACRGVHFAITDEQRARLVGLAIDDERIDFVQLEIEERWDTEHLQETDKAWDAIHRCLGEFPPNTSWFYPVDLARGAYALPEEHGSYPLKLCVLGGRKITDDESRYFIRLIEPNEVADLARALQPIDFEWLSKRYFRHCEGAWPEYGEEDLQYTWEWFEALREFFVRIGPTGRAVIFTADQ